MLLRKMAVAATSMILSIVLMTSCDDSPVIPPADEEYHQDLIVIFSSRLDFDVGGIPRSICSCDLDGDGNTDLAVANSSSDNISVLLGA